MSSPRNFNYVVIFCVILRILYSGTALENVDNSYDLLCASDLDSFNCQCPLDDTTSQVNCSDRQIVSLPTDISFTSGVKRIVFKNNKIKSISSNVFSHGIGLTYLDLSRNAIKFIAASAFMEIGNLETLDLSHNAIWSIGINVFEGLTNLETLDLSYNLIGEFFGEIFQPCDSLQVLILKYNQLMFVDDHRFNYLINLQKLDLQNTGLAFFPENVFRNNTDLRELILAGNSFQDVPTKTLQKLKNLQYLDLSQNPISILRTGEFQGLASLKTLVLNNMNRLSQVYDHAMTKLSGLEELFMSHNPQLKTISSNAFTSTDEMSLRGNEAGLNSTLSSNTRIRRLYLRHNNLETLPETLVNWKDLEDAEFQDNPWKCDCHISWMATNVLRRAMRNKLSCKSPQRLQGRKFVTLSQTDFSCDYLSPAAVIGISLLVLGALSLVLSGSAFLIYRHKMCSCRKGRSQNGYARVISSKDRVDLEWDHTAEPSKDA